MNLKDIMGYKENSPFNNEPYLDINTTAGKITMKDVNKPLLGIDENGFMQLMQPNNEYQFTSNKVKEVPLFQDGGDMAAYQQAIASGKISPLVNFETWKAQIAASSNINGANVFTGDNMSTPFNLTENPTTANPFSPVAPEKTISVGDNIGSPFVFNDKPTTNTPINLVSSNNPMTVEWNKELDVKSNWETPNGQTTNPTDTPQTQKSFLDYLSGAMPYIGSGVSLEDRFRVLGRSLNFDSESIKDPNMREKAGDVNTGVGIVAGLSGLLGATRATLSGAGYQNKMNQFYNQYFKDQSKLQQSEYKYPSSSYRVFEEGGSFDMLDLDPEEIMLNNLIAALPKAMEEMANAEIEKDEYVVQKDGIKLAVGDSHAEGGIKVVLSDGDKIISDKLELGKEYKELNEKYDISLNKNTSYAEAITKYSTKIGLDKINEELKELYAEVIATKKLEDTDTKRINLTFLETEIKEKETEKASLSRQQLEFTQEVYNKQEANKLPKFEKGGQFISALAKKHGLSEEEAKSILSKYQDGGEQGNINIEQIAQQYALMQGLNPQEVLAQLSTMDEKQKQEAIAQMQQVISTAPQTFQDGGQKQLDQYVNDWTGFKQYEYSPNSLPQMKERIKQFATEWGGENLIPQIENARTIQELDIIAGTLQDKVKQSPELATDYGTKVAPTQKGLQYLLDKGVVSTNDLLKVGVKVSNGKVNSGSYSTNNINAIKEVVNSKLTDKPELAKEYAVSNFNDKQWYFRYPSRKTVEFTDKTAYDNFVKDKKTVDGEYYSLGNAEGLYIKPVYTAPKAENTPPPAAETTGQPTKGNTSSPVGPLQINQSNPTLSMLLMPDAVNLPPDSIFPHVKREYRGTYLDPVAISPDQQLSEINRIQNTQNQILDYLPENMSGANTANNTALLLSEASKAIANANNFNVQNRQQTEQFNVGVDNQDEMMRYNEIPRYEELQLTALEKTKADYYNYFNQMYENQMNKIQTQNNVNLVDSMFDNVTYDIFGKPIVDKSTFVPLSKLPSNK